MLIRSSHRHKTISALYINFIALLSRPLVAQAGPKVASIAPQDASRITALMLSDLHVDVFYDPKKVNELISAPASHWEEIFSAQIHLVAKRISMRYTQRARCYLTRSTPCTPKFFQTHRPFRRYFSLTSSIFRVLLRDSSERNL